MKYLNRDPEIGIHQWRDDFIRIPFPRLASTSARQIAEAAVSYKREAATIDARLSREVTCAFKGAALSDLCDQLRADTGIQLSAGPSVADEKVTVFCEKLPLRDVMRQLSHPFGYTWLRSKREGGEYRYELMQDLKSQLLEEELRNRDRDGALLALAREMDRYRPYLDLTPDEALARAQSAAPGDKELLLHLAHTGWGPIQMFFRLTPDQLAILRSGDGLAFSTEPYPTQRPLPSDLVRGVLQSIREHRVIKSDEGLEFTNDLDNLKALPLSAVPGVGAQIRLWMPQSEVGQFSVEGESGFFGPKKDNDLVYSDATGYVYAVGRSPASSQPDNASVNARLANDPALRGRISVQPQPACNLPSNSSPARGETREPKVTTTEVLEALHGATGLPVVADFYTRLYKPETAAVKNRPLFEALNSLADGMKLRWHKEGGWLQFRSSSYYYDRLKEVPNRLLRRWQAARGQHGMLTLDDLCEIAQLPDAQVDGADMAEGARECWGLAEWGLAGDKVLRPHLRYLAGFTPEGRREALSPAGLPFTKMSLAQQQEFIANSLYGYGEPLESLDELAGSALRVDYTPPGWFEWQPPGAFRWALPVEPGPQGRRILQAPVRERNREAALAAASRAEPQLREALRKRTRYHQMPDEKVDELLRSADVAPTRLYLAIVYVPGAANKHPLHVFDNGANRGIYTGTE